MIKLVEIEEEKSSSPHQDPDTAWMLKKELEHISYIFSHDFIKPVRNISLLCEDLKQEAEQATRCFNINPLKLIIRDIEQSASDLKFMIDSVFQYTQLQLAPPSLSIIACGKLLTEEIQKTQLQHPKTKIELRVDNTTDYSYPIILGNAKLLSFLFGQLIDNAIKFCPQGQHPIISINISKIEGIEEKYLFEFADNGIGIEDEYSEIIFDLFQRLHTNDEIPGYGVGLALCKKIVQLHGGQIWFKSQTNSNNKFSGSKFSFTLSNRSNV